MDVQFQQSKLRNALPSSWNHASTSPLMQALHVHQATSGHDEMSVAIRIRIRCGLHTDEPEHDLHSTVSHSVHNRRSFQERVGLGFE